MTDQKQSQATRGDNIGGDKITVGNIENSNVVAVGAGVTAVYNAGLTVEKVATLLVKLKNEDQPIVWNGRYPYLGLTAFQESDAQFFFGRERLVDELLERVKAARFIVIAEPSGSGKSSACGGCFTPCVKDDWTKALTGSGRLWRFRLEKEANG